MSAFDNIKAAFTRKPRQLDAEDMAGIDDLSVNEAQKKKQNMLLAIIAVFALFLGSYYIFSGEEKPGAITADGTTEYKVATGDLVNRNMSEKEWMARSEARFQSIENQMKARNGAAPQVDQLQAQLASAQSQNASMASEGNRALSAYQQENEQLRAALAASKSAPVMAGPTAMYGNRSPVTYTTTTPGGTVAGNAALAAVSAEGRSKDVKLVSFEAGPAGTATRISGGTTAYTDSPNYLPPNSIARAKVIVGVDASAGVSSQSDPLPVVLRVTGPARSVYRQGKLLTTAIQGCLVNGAARGDLSSEKVYVKLQRMTCPQSNGRYAVSDVKGFIAFAGKTGVRGRVVSREGSLVTQGFLAGLAGGFGRGFSANANAIFQAPNIIGSNGRRQQLSTEDILQGGFGEGVSQSADQVSKYLIERAEQYQPVIEMPTGIDVEIVFLEGVFIQN